MKKRMLSVLLVMFIVSAGVNAQSRNPFSLALTPGAELPLGPKNTDGTVIFSYGGSATLAGEYTMPFATFLFAKGLLGYSMISTLAQTTFSLATIGAGAGVKFSPFSKVELKFSGTGGYSLAIYQGKVAGSPFFGGEGRVLYALSPVFSLGIGGSYTHARPFYNGVGVFLGVSLNLGAGQLQSKMDVNDIKLDPVFPVFYQYYDDNPLGSVVIKNTENGPVKDVRVSFFVQQYMDKPKLCGTRGEMKKNEEIEIPLFALFKNSILEITEGTKVNSEILVEYNFLDTVITGDTSETIQMYHRNAMTWDDDRKAASFVTAKDPEILRFSKNITGDIRDIGSTAVNNKFREAMGLFESLKQYGIDYVIDPTSAYAALSQDELSLDYLQFPIQTMSYKAGDCDDLSILYAALLESIGIETAFITIPGHIYMAFSIGMSPAQAKAEFLRPDDLIFTDTEAWVPVEITMVKDGFLKAWQTGIKQWKENEGAGTAVFYPVHEAWGTYPPVGMTDPNARIENLDNEKVIQTFTADLLKFVEREISGKVKELQDMIRESGNDPQMINKLGVLYARTGLYNRAQAEFEKAAGRGFAASRFNLGNIYFLREEYEKALDYYNGALREFPDNTKVLVAVARSHYELEDYDSARSVYEKIEEINPEKAAEFTYLLSTQ
ncbi:MAG: tetratricopeptide repeat protein [Spirochaetales bacterium]|nr:tetratricopeptide repeat protein [Spirochaetales bacterium]